MYTALVLHEADQAKLLSLFPVPEGWTPFAHHMTINMGTATSGPAADLLGQEAELTVVAVGTTGIVRAVKVETTVPSTNETKHITLAVNRMLGGKPFQSNQIKEWEPVPPVSLKGTVMEVQ